MFSDTHLCIALTLKEIEEASEGFAGKLPNGHDYNYALLIQEQEYESFIASLNLANGIEGAEPLNLDLLREIQEQDLAERNDRALAIS